MSRWTLYQVAVLVVFAIVVGGVWWSLSQRTAPAPKADKTEPQVSPEALHHFQVFLHRKPCASDCRDYAVLAKGSGKIEYVGGKNVAMHGTQTAPLTVGQLEALYRSVKQAKFFSIPDIYHNGPGGTGCSALIAGKPRVVIGVTRKGQTKVIHYDYGCRGAPAKLARLADSIDSVLKTQRWTGPGQ
ncbi:MAG TPA: DUF6438 domain-containing protein [Gammaproteobacteria bacterium]|nr:DUF6438 domain-containing protein [Gammaproteobacteria bacterium]